MNKFTAKIIKTPADHKEYDVRFFEKGEETNGFGFLSKRGKDKRIALIKCPQCGQENYAINVNSGNCTWCDFSTEKIIDIIK